MQTLRVGLGSDIPEVRSCRLAAVQGVRNGFCGCVNLDDVFSRGILLLLLPYIICIVIIFRLMYRFPYYYCIPADIYEEVVIFFIYCWVYPLFNIIIVII